MISSLLAVHRMVVRHVGFTAAGWIPASAGMTEWIVRSAIPEPLERPQPRSRSEEMP